MMKLNDFLQPFKNIFEYSKDKAKNVPEIFLFKEIQNFENDLNEYSKQLSATNKNINSLNLKTAIYKPIEGETKEPLKQLVNKIHSANGNLDPILINIDQLIFKSIQIIQKVRNEISTQNTSWITYKKREKKVYWSDEWHKWCSWLSILTRYVLTIFVAIIIYSYFSNSADKESSFLRSPLKDYIPYQNKE